MTPLKWLIVLILSAMMLAAAVGFGRWAESVNPEGITEPVTTANLPDTQTPSEPVVTNSRDAFTFGASIGLLAASLLYATFAIALLIRAKSKGWAPDQLTYWIAGLAGVGLALSYLVDDYFY